MCEAATIEEAEKADEDDFLEELIDLLETVVGFVVVIQTLKLRWPKATLDFLAMSKDDDTNAGRDTDWVQEREDKCCIEVEVVPAA